MQTATAGTNRRVVAGPTIPNRLRGDWTMDEIAEENYDLQLQREGLALRTAQLFERAQALEDIRDRLRPGDATLVEIVQIIEARIGIFSPRVT